MVEDRTRYTTWYPEAGGEGKGESVSHVTTAEAGGRASDALTLFTWSRWVGRIECGYEVTQRKERERERKREREREGEGGREYT